MADLDDQAIEDEIVEKELTAPRVTIDELDKQIVGEHYWVAPDTTTTVCVLVLKNGFTVVDSCACASPENFDKELGQKLARKRAKQQIWPLQGYLLKQRLFEEAYPLEVLSAS